MAKGFGDGSTRHAAVAGTFYPGDPQSLGAELDRCLGAEADRPAPIAATAIVVPHAGYVYSGRTAGRVYARVEVPDRCVVLCPNHTGLGAPRALSPAGAWAIPGAEVPIDAALGERIAERAGLAADSRAHEREHAIEVQLPFLWRRNPRVRVTAICLSVLRLEECLEIGEAIAETLRALGEPVLLVASTDMSHYIPAERAETLDRLAIARIEAVDAEGLYRTVVDRDISMCGFIPTTVVLQAARTLGARKGQLVRYSNSAEASGDRSSVVGYAGLTVA